MNNFLEVFNDELKKVQNEEQDESSQIQHDDNYLEEIERDLGKISEIYEPLIEVIKQKFDNTAEIKSPKDYKVEEEITINYKDSTAISYQLQKNKVSSNVPAAYRIRIGGKLQLPDMLVQTNDNGNYYYFEDKHTSAADTDKDDLVGIPYQDKDGVVESNQFDKVLEKHIGRLARYIGKR
ncbi:hypothetical protein [Jeotgalicoccus halotolerans]|uniref:Uncharacterized protein n=1 Tax=Jeotgalicoccus halotolerans TaxID=157227 RepID=A0A3E0B130_9STAP|nr:hypothetical protein [Jeotgalicoccus halotolerans]REG25673.1 hypothetical protein DFR63_0716 [Jeotgalicoccus halotolerans]